MMGGGEAGEGQDHHSLPCMSLRDNTYDRMDSTNMSLSEQQVIPALFVMTRTTFSSSFGMEIMISIPYRIAVMAK